MMLASLSIIYLFIYLFIDRRNCEIEHVEVGYRGTTSSLNDPLAPNALTKPLWEM